MASGALGTILGGFGGGVIGGAVVSLGLDDAGYRKSLMQTQALNEAEAGRTKALWTAGFAAAGVAAIAFAKTAISAFAESERVQAQTAATIKSTGGAAGFTADQIHAMAGELEHLTTFSDEEVQSAENLLLTFVGIGHEVLPEATQAVLDMSTALGQDLKSSAIQVGKALNDPTVGLTALRRVGVTFNDEQVKVITNLYETGKAAEAQRLVLAELTKEFGGSAQAAAKTFSGQMKQLANQFDDVMEKIGQFLVAGLKPLLEGLSWLLANLPTVIKFVLAFGAAWAVANYGLILENLTFIVAMIRTLPAVLSEATAAFRALGETAVITGSQMATGLAIIPGLGGVKQLNDIQDALDQMGESGLTTAQKIKFLSGEFDINAVAARRAIEGGRPYAETLADVQNEAKAAADKLNAVASASQLARQRFVNFAHLTRPELKDWRRSVGENIDGIVFDLSNLDDSIGVSKRTLIQAFNAMEQRGKETKHAFRELSREHWVNDEFQKFLAESPDLLVTFEQVSKEKQQKMQAQWLTTADRTDAAKTAVERMSDALKKLDGSVHYTVHVDYVPHGLEGLPGLTQTRGGAP